MWTDELPQGMADTTAFPGGGAFFMLRSLKIYLCSHLVEPRAYLKANQDQYTIHCSQSYSIRQTQGHALDCWMVVRWIIEWLYQ